MTPIAGKRGIEWHRRRAMKRSRGRDRGMKTSLQILTCAYNSGGVLVGTMECPTLAIFEE